jgi:hypothetical protein
MVRANIGIIYQKRNKMGNKNGQTGALILVLNKLRNKP